MRPGTGSSLLFFKDLRKFLQMGRLRAEWPENSSRDETLDRWSKCAEFRIHRGSMRE